MQRPSLSAIAELLKPVTWFPPMWAFGCGVVASGMPVGGRWPLVVAGVLLAGPFVCATSQAVNDWFDREVDAINEPQRPIPSGRMPGRWGLFIAIAWTLLSVALAASLGPVAFAAAAVGLLLAWAYSAPPLRLKRNGWWGNGACALCYEGLAWITGAAVMAMGAWPHAHSLALALLYSLAAHGIMTLNDFKSIEGDRRTGIASLPVRLGVRGAAATACATMIVPQLLVAALLTGWGRPGHACIVAALVAGQLAMMRRFMRDPRARALWYSGAGVPLFVAGMLVSAFALRAQDGRMTRAAFGWGSVVRLGVVQAALGAVVVLTTSTLNRIMIVELALPALLPGLLVGLHYVVQLARPRVGHGADAGGSRTRWILGGMGVLALGGVLAALATAWMATERGAGIALASVAFVLIGLGVAACGTNLLALLASRVAPERRAAAATVVWLMMILGFAVTAGVAGRLLDPYSPGRLVAVSLGVSLCACAATLVATLGVERRAAPTAADPVARPAARVDFRTAVGAVFADVAARRFTLFVFVSMLAFSAQELILEPFAGSVFAFTPGQSTSLSGAQHGGVFAGMLLAALAGRRWGRTPLGSLRAWSIGGCLASALALAGLTAAAVVGRGWPLVANVWLMGAANGAFSIAAIGSMMGMASDRHGAREGVRIGVWGAAQALAFALGGLVGTGATDLARAWVAAPGPAYAAVFAFEALLFVLAARLAAAVASPTPSGARALNAGDDLVAAAGGSR